MSKKATYLAVLLATGLTTAQAHDVSCELDMSYDIDLDNQQIVLSEKNQTLVRIDANNQLYLKGDKQNLDSRQKDLLADYAKDIRKLLPAASEVALEATDLALEAITDVSKALLTNSPDKAQRLVARVKTISEEVKQHISEQHLRPSGIESYFDGNKFEQEFEALIEEAVANFAQSGLSDIISAAIRGDEAEIEAFEERMEQFSKDMETKFEAKAELVGAKAESLCELVEQIDDKEEAFIKSFKKFADYELVSN